MIFLYSKIQKRNTVDGDDKPWGPGSHFYEHITTQQFSKRFCSIRSV